MKQQREKVEQAHGVQLLRVLGAKVYVSGTRRKHDDFQGTMQTPGIPDVEAWLPARDSRMGGPLVVLLKWEVKARDGRLSPAQREYAELCHDAEVAHVAGDYDALIRWLIENDYAKPEQFPTYRLPAVKSTASQ